MKPVYRLLLLVFSILVFGTCSSSGHNYIVYVGTYTGKGSDGIYAYQFNPAMGDITSIGLVAKTENPSYLTIDSTGHFLYALNEIDSFRQKLSGAISVFSISKVLGKLTLLQQIPSLGAGPAHISLDKSGRYLFVANYNGGNVALFPRNDDGTLGTSTMFIQDSGSSVNVERQTMAHAHYIGASPDNKFVLVADLGIDKILIYNIHLESGLLTVSDPGSLSLRPGDGPRHISFSPSGKFMFVVNELSSTITAFSLGNETGNFRQLETVSTLPKGFFGVNTAAEIITDSDGKHLYVSNRGHDTIAVFNIDLNGKLIPVEWSPSGGSGPRHIMIDPTGQWLFAANQYSNRIALFQIDQASGRLTQSLKSIDIISPVCIEFCL